MNRGIERHDLVFSVGLSLVTVLSRLPYRTRMLYNWDAVQFALALKEYDIAEHQPHPPGYILYVLIWRSRSTRAATAGGGPSASLELASTILPLPESEIRVPARVRQLVWFVDHWDPAMPKPPGLTEIELPYGRHLYVLRLGPRPVQYAGYTIVRERPLRAGRAAR